MGTATSIKDYKFPEGFSEKDAEKVLNSLDEIENSELVQKTYKLMAEKGRINLASSPIYELLCPTHLLGELVLTKDKGFETMFYDADFGIEIYSKPKKLEMRVFGQTKEDIEKSIEDSKNYLERKIKSENKINVNKKNFFSKIFNL